MVGMDPILQQGILNHVLSGLGHGHIREFDGNPSAGLELLEAYAAYG